MADLAIGAPEAVEAAVEETPVDAVETQTETPDPAEGTADAGERPPAEVRTDNRTLSPEMRSHLAELQQTNPKLAGQIRDNLFAQQAFRREFPGGLKEIRALRTVAEEVGGETGIRDLQQTAQEIAELDELWEKGDPSAIEGLAEDYPEQFKAMAPRVLEKLQQMDAQAYTAALTPVFAATLAQSGLGNTLWKIEQCLKYKDYDGVQAEVGAINSWLNGWLKAPAAAAPSPGTAKPSDREQQLQAQLAKREEAEFNSSVENEIKPALERTLQAEIGKLSKGQKLSPESLQIFRLELNRRVTETLWNSKDFANTFQRYQNRRDKAGLIRFVRSRSEALMVGNGTQPGLIAKVYGAISRYGAPAKPGAKAGAPGAQIASAPAGWTRINKAPAPHEIDNSRRDSFHLGMNDAAYLKNGKKVYWGDRAPA